MFKNHALFILTLCAMPTILQSAAPKTDSDDAYSDSAIEDDSAIYHRTDDTYCARLFDENGQRIRPSYASSSDDDNAQPKNFILLINETKYGLSCVDRVTLSGSIPRNVIHIKPYKVHIMRDCAQLHFKLDPDGDDLKALITKLKAESTTRTLKMADLDRYTTQIRFTQLKENTGTVIRILDLEGNFERTES